MTPSSTSVYTKPPPRGRMMTKTGIRTAAFTALMEPMVDQTFVAHNPAVRWSLATRLAFRFVVIFFSLYVLLTQMFGALPRVAAPPPDLPTLLHLLGVEHKKLTFKFQGLDARLTGVEPAKVVKALLA